MKKKRTLAVALTLVACRTVAQPGSQAAPETLRKDPIAKAPESVPDAAPPKDVKPPPPKDEAPPRWGKLPETSGELFSVVDGACKGLDLHAVEGAMLATYTASYTAASVVRLTDDGVGKLPDAKHDQLGMGRVTSIVGRWPDALWLSFDDGGRCVQHDSALRLAGKTWKPAFDLTEQDSIRGVRPYKEGAIGLHVCADRCGGAEASSCTSGTMWSDALARTPPIASGGGFEMRDFTTLPDDTIVAFGAACPPSATTCTSAQLRTWAPGGKVQIYPFTTEDSRLRAATHMFARSATDVVVSFASTVYAFDGTKVRKLGTASDTIYALVDRGAEGVWAALGNNKIVAIASDGTTTDITPPRVGKGYGLLTLGAKGETAWAANGDALYRREAGAWRRVELPRPPFSSTSAYLTPTGILVRGPDDVWVTATYHEQQPGWSEREVRTTILRTKRPKQTLRCRVEPTGESSRLGGLLAWPAPVSETCKTPFVLLAAVSPSSPKTNDYPKTRALLRPLASEIPDGNLVELKSDDVSWIGVRAASPDAARKIAGVYAKSYPMVHPEAVCADPEPTRTIAIDPKAKDGGP